MKRKHVILIGILVVAGLALGVGTVATQRMADDDIAVSIDEVPASVKATILAQAKGNPINEIEKETENGVIVYEAEVVIDGRETDIVVAEDGTLLGTEVDDEEGDDEDEEGDDDEDDEEDVTVAFADVPAAVKDTLAKEAPNAEIKEIEKETEEGRLVYEVEVVIDGQTCEIEIAENGELLGKEVEDDDD